MEEGQIEMKESGKVEESVESTEQETDLTSVKEECSSSEPLEQAAKDQQENGASESEEKTEIQTKASDEKNASVESGTATPEVSSAQEGPEKKLTKVTFHASHDSTAGSSDSSSTISGNKSISEERPDLKSSFLKKGADSQAIKSSLKSHLSSPIASGSESSPLLNTGESKQDEIEVVSEIPSTRPIENPTTIENRQEESCDKSVVWTVVICVIIFIIFMLWFMFYPFYDNRSVPRNVSGRNVTGSQNSTETKPKSRSQNGSL